MSAVVDLGRRSPNALSSARSLRSDRALIVHFVLREQPNTAQSLQIANSYTGTSRHRSHQKPAMLPRNTLVLVSRQSLAPAWAPSLLYAHQSERACESSCRRGLDLGIFSLTIVTGNTNGTAVTRLPSCPGWIATVDATPSRHVSLASLEGVGAEPNQTVGTHLPFR